MVVYLYMNLDLLAEIEAKQLNHLSQLQLENGKLKFLFTAALWKVSFVTARLVILWEEHIHLQRELYPFLCVTLQPKTFCRSLIQIQSNVSDIFKWQIQDKVNPMHSYSSKMALALIRLFYIKISQFHLSQSLKLELAKLP